MKRGTVASGIKSLYKDRGLLRSLVIRDIESRYRGTLLGILWAVIYPLMMLAIYAFVFGGVFNARWRTGGGMKDFALMVYCGLIIHGMFSETISRAPTAVLANPSYVKKVVFPLELLPFCQLATAVFNAVVGITLVAIFVLAVHHELPVTALLAPLVLLPLVLLTAGVGWFLAALGVFFRDAGQMVPVLSSVLLFLSPVFYPASAAPSIAQRLMNWNPLTFPMEGLRAVLILGDTPAWGHLAAYSVAASCVALGGLWVFQKARPAFPDVI